MKKLFLVQNLMPFPKNPFFNEPKRFKQTGQGNFYGSRDYMWSTQQARMPHPITPRPATNNPVPPKPATSRSHSFNTSTSLYRPSTIPPYSSANNKPTPLKPANVQSNAVNGSTSRTPSMTPHSSTANKPILPKPTNVQSNAVNGSTSRMPSITPHSSTANKPTAPKPTNVESNAVNGSTSRTPSMTPHSSTANKPTLPKPTNSQSNAVNGSTSRTPSMTPHSSTANKPIVPQPTNVQSNAVNGSTSWTPSVTSHSSTANKPIVPKPTNVQSNAVNGSTSWTPSMTSPHSSTTNKPIAPKPINVQSNAVNGSTSWTPSMTPHSSTANKPILPKPTNVESNAVNGSTSRTPSMTPHSSTANKPIVPKPTNVESNAVNGSTSRTPSMTLHSSTANKPIAPNPTNVQSNRASGPISIKSSTSHQTSVANNNMCMPSTVQVPVTSELNTKTKDEIRTSAFPSQGLYLPVLDKGNATFPNGAEPMNVCGASTSCKGDYPAPGLGSSSSYDVEELDSDEPIDEWGLLLSPPGFTFDSDDNKMNVVPSEVNHLMSVDPSLDQPEPQHITTQENSYESVYRVLICSVCENWMSQDQIKLCACKIVCESCAAPLTKCEDCQFSFKHDVKLVNFHQRLARLIDRPCKYKQHGCPLIIHPGDEHELTCEYFPEPCHKCHENVSRLRMQEHFDRSHFLKSKSLDVKLADFYLEDTGSRKIKCVTNKGLVVFISILNVESVGEFNQFTIVYPDTDLNVSVKLDFNFEGYTYSRMSTKPPNNDDGLILMSSVDIGRKQFSDWINGKSNLDIDVAVRKKRQFKTQLMETVIKQPIKKKKKKENCGMDKKVMKTLQAAHKQRKRNKYFKNP